MKPISLQSKNDQRQQIFASQIATLTDLQDLKVELLHEIRKILKEHGGQATKKWLKTSEVRKLLDASPGTLQRLRNNGTLPFTKIGGVVYYDYDELSKLLQPDNNYSQKTTKRPI